MNEDKRTLADYLKIGHIYRVSFLGEESKDYKLLDMNDQVMLLEPTQYTNNPVAIVVPWASVLNMVIVA